MPASRYAPAQAAVMVTYTTQSMRAVWVMRGVSFASFTGPGISARYSDMPPTPSMGSSATARITMPMPPSHCSCWR